MDWKKLQSQATSVAKATGHAANSAYKAGKEKYATSSASSSASLAAPVRRADVAAAELDIPPALPPRLPSRAISVNQTATQIPQLPARERATDDVSRLPSRTDIASHQAAIRATYGTAMTDHDLPGQAKIQKKPPPIPPPKQTRPPVPTTTRPKAIQTQHSGVHPDIHLFPLFSGPQLARDLPVPKSPAWYAKQPLVLPSIITSTGSYTYGAGGSGFPGKIQYTQVYALQHADLSQTKIKLQYNECDPVRTVRIEQRHVSVPRPLTTAGLIACAEQYGPALVAYCRAHWGQQVGNGECWTLASDGLKSIPGALESQGVVHGHPIYRCQAGERCVQIEHLRAGDIIQYWSAKFHNPRTGTTSWAGMPDHTAIITSTVSAEKSHAGTAFPQVTCILAEQNVGGVKRVQEGRVDLDTLVEGLVTVYRPVHATWVQPLTAEWWIKLAV